MKTQQFKTALLLSYALLIALFGGIAYYFFFVWSGIMMAY